MAERMSESFTRDRVYSQEELDFLSDFRADFASYLDTIEDSIAPCRERSLIKTELEGVMHRIEDAVLAVGLKP